MGARCSSQVETSVRPNSIQTRDIEDRPEKSTQQPYHEVRGQRHTQRKQDEKLNRQTPEDRKQHNTPHGENFQRIPTVEVVDNYRSKKSHSIEHRKSERQVGLTEEPSKKQPVQHRADQKERTEKTEHDKWIKDGADQIGNSLHESDEFKKKTREKRADPSPQVTNDQLSRQSVRYNSQDNQKTLNEYNQNNTSYGVENLENHEPAQTQLRSDINSNFSSGKTTKSQQQQQRQIGESSPQIQKPGHSIKKEKVSLSYHASRELNILSKDTQNGMKPNSFVIESREIEVQPVGTEDSFNKPEIRHAPLHADGSISVHKKSNIKLREHKTEEKPDSPSAKEISHTRANQSERQQHKYKVTSKTLSDKVSSSSSVSQITQWNKEEEDLTDVQGSNVSPNSVQFRPKYTSLEPSKGESYSTSDLYSTGDLTDEDSDSDVDIKQYPNLDTVLAVSGNSSTPSKYTSTFPPHTLSPRKKSKTGSQTIPADRPSLPLSASTKSVVTSENPDDWEPFKDPDSALREALKSMGQPDWETKCNGINMIRRLSKYHPDVLTANLHTVIIALIAEVKNLRSQVSRLAVVCFGDLFQALRTKMDPDLDTAIKALLAKNGESNGFIRDDVDRALSLMVEYSNPQRALIALIGGGATHKNSAVRKTAAIFLVDVVERMGPGKILSGVKDITDKVLPNVAQFTIDTSPETRYNGRKILFMLMNHQDFDRMLSKHLPANTLKSVTDTVETLRTKGLGDVPSESMSARSRRSGQGSRSSSFRGGSATSSSMSGMMDSTKRRVVRTDDKTQDEIKQILSLLTANDWRDRNQGLNDFLQFTETNTSIVAHQIVKIFDKFLPRLQDSNSKVNLRALQVMLSMIPLLKDHFSSVINLTLQNVSPNLNSKNVEIKQAATEILEKLLEQLDGSLLMQPFANQALSASSRSQPDMIEKVAYLVSKVYGKKQKPVVLHVLPLLWSLLGVNSRGVSSGSSPVRTATVKLVHSLYDYMGDTLLDHAHSNPGVSSKHIELLQDLIDD